MSRSIKAARTKAPVVQAPKTRKDWKRAVDPYCDADPYVGDGLDAWEARSIPCGGCGCDESDQIKCEST